MAALLKITYADGRSQELSLPDGAHEIGRDSGAVVLHDHGASARHARLDVANGQVWLTDLGSSNGTFDPSGARISGARGMRPHEPFRLGASTVMLLPAGGATRAMPQVAPAALQANPEPPTMQRAGYALANGWIAVPSDWSSRRYADGGPPVIFGVETGVVAGSETRSVSHVSGYVSSSGGGQISTAVVAKCEFILHTDDGRQASYTLTNINVILRNGQRISMLWGLNEGYRNRSYLRIVHHDGETVHQVDPAKKAAIALGQAKSSTAQGGCLVAMLGTVAVLAIILAGANWSYQVLWLPSLVGLFVWARADGRNTMSISRFDRHASGIAAELLAFIVAEKRKRAR